MLVLLRYLRNRNGTQLFAPDHLPEFALYFVDTNNPNTCSFYYDTSAIETARNFLRRLTCPSLRYTLLIRIPKYLLVLLRYLRNRNCTQLFAPDHLPEFALYFVNTNNPNTCSFYYDTSAIETARNFLRQPTCPQGLPALDKRCELGYNNG